MYCASLVSYRATVSCSLSQCHRTHSARSHANCAHTRLWLNLKSISSVQTLQTVMAQRTLCPQGRPRHAPPHAPIKTAMCPGTVQLCDMPAAGAAHGIEARRKRRSLCTTCQTHGEGGSEACASDPCAHAGCTRGTAARHHMATVFLCAPAPTSFADSSAPEPLRAVGIGVPDPPSPGDHIFTPGRPCRAPPPPSP